MHVKFVAQSLGPGKQQLCRSFSTHLSAHTSLQSETKSCSRQKHTTATKERSTSLGSYFGFRHLIVPYLWPVGCVCAWF